jgi:hypothetical protein
MRWGLWISMVLVFFLGVGFVFWNTQVKYLLPTPMPGNVNRLKIGEKVSLAQIPFKNRSNQPVYFHFYNPDCPCTRFNLKEVRKIAFENKNDLKFVVVAQSKKHSIQLEEDIANLFLNEIEVVIDSTGVIAQNFGVYSSPQVVLVDENQKIVYSGNYNVSRYCTKQTTSFAQLAVNYLKTRDLSLLNEIKMGSELAPYGCLLPTYE